jgi:hypothetical protein
MTCKNRPIRLLLYYTAQPSPDHLLSRPPSSIPVERHWVAFITNCTSHSWFVVHICMPTNCFCCVFGKCITVWENDGPAKIDRHEHSHSDLCTSLSYARTATCLLTHTFQTHAVAQLQCNRTEEDRLNLRGSRSNCQILRASPRRSRHTVFDDIKFYSRICAIRICHRPQRGVQLRDTV